MASARQLGLGVGFFAASVVVVALVMRFLAPDLSYQTTDRITEIASGRGNRPYRIGLGVTTGSTYHLGTVLNRYLKERAGYELELVASAGVGVRELLDPAEQIDLAALSSFSDEAARAKGLTSLAALERNYFFVIVPNESPVREIRDLSGPVNPGQRAPGRPATLGERVFEYYGLLSSSATREGRGPAVTIIRPGQDSMAKDFESGRHVAVTRNQFLHADLIDGLLNVGTFRLVPIRDHEALARAMPGTEPGFIPAGAYGPQRGIPPAPVPTLVTTSLLVSRADLPGRIVRDILDVVYDPRFGRDIAFDLTEEFGRKVGDVPLHPAADIYYHRNDLLTSDRMGRLSFVVSIVGGVFAVSQFALRYRRDERRTARRRLLAADLKKLEALRHKIEASPDSASARTLIGEADDLLSGAERDAAADLLDAEGVQSLRSLHRICTRALQHRLES